MQLHSQEKNVSRNQRTIIFTWKHHRCTNQHRKVIIVAPKRKRQNWSLSTLLALFNFNHNKGSFWNISDISWSYIWVIKPFIQNSLQSNNDLYFWYLLKYHQKWCNITQNKAPVKCLVRKESGMIVQFCWRQA